MKSELYLSALALCQLGLSQTRAASGKPLRREDIQECVTEILDMKKFKGQVDGDALVKELEELFTIWSDLPGALDNDDDNHEPWLEQRGPDINWRFWNRYRDKYLDVCRLYMTADLKEWFRHIAAATEELRLEFEHMVSVRAKPSAYGLKVRSHPTLLVTSQTKMKTGTELSLSYSGAISETIIFDKDQGVIDSNLNATRTLLDSVGDPASGDVSGGYIWHRVGSQKILDFLGAYSSHSNANRADTRLLARYIRRQLEDDELVSWTVKLASSGTGLVHFDDLVGGKKVQGITRSVYPLENENDMARYSIRRLVSPSDELCDLSDDELKIALEHTRLLWERSTRTNKPKTEPDAPSGPGIRFARAKHKALLIIYPLDPAVPKPFNQCRTLEDTRTTGWSRHNQS